MSSPENIGSYRPEHLGLKSSDPVAEIDRIPWQGGEIEIVLECREFTSRCPITGQPDFGTLTIRYCPGQWLIETKSMKLYLCGYRDRGVFSEDLVSTICNDLYEQISPTWLEVEGHFNSRGGIAINAKMRLPQPCDRQKGQNSHG